MESTRSSEERQQFEALVARNQAAICAMAYAVLRDRARSEEVAQDALLLAWRDRASTPPTAAWLCGIARNLARNAARRRREVAMSHETEHESTSDPRADLIAREELACAAAALATLPDSYREALAVYHRTDDSYAETSAALGITEATARQRVHRARERLRERVTTVERTLRATRPGAAFTAAVVGAFAAGVRPSVAAAASSAPASKLPAGLGVALGLGVAAVATVIAMAVVMSSPGAPTPRDSPPRSNLPFTLAPAAPPLAAGAAVAPSTDGSGGETRPAGGALRARPRPRLSPALDAHLRRTIDFDFAQAPFGAVIAILSEQIETPIWSTIDPATEVTLRFERTPALDVLDSALEQAGAARVEVPAVRIVERGRTDASSLGGEPVTLAVTNMPLAQVLERLEPHLAMPIGGVSAVKGASPLVSLDVHDVPAGTVLEHLLVEQRLGFEVTSGFVIEDDEN